MSEHIVRTHEEYEDKPVEGLFEDTTQQVSEVQARVTLELGLPPDSPEAVAATDTALLYGARTEGAFLTPAVAGVLELQGLRLTEARNPIDVLEEDYPVQLAGVVEQLAHQADPTGLEAAHLIAAEADRLQASLLMGRGPKGVEYLPQVERQQPTLSAELALVPEKLRSRIDQAVNAAEFVRSPELEQAIAGYYIDHTKLATVMDRIITNDLSAEERVALLDGPAQTENFVINNAINALLKASGDQTNREASLRLTDEVMQLVLFKESCVGATTLDETETSQLVDLQEKLRAAALREGAAFQSGQDIRWSHQLSPSDTQRRLASPDEAADIHSEAEVFWQDSRFAGQLLFHNTPFMGEVAKDGFKLLSRTARAARDGSFDSATAVYETTNGAPIESHTNVTHWSEYLMTDEYKTDNKGKSTADKANHPATIAVPLGEMIKIAPYARDCQYGVLSVKEDKTEAQITINDGALIAADPNHFANTGETDAMGESGKDRVFFADYRAEHADEALNYELDFGVGMATEQGNAAKIILLQRDLDRLKKAKFQANGELFDQPSYGAGYGYPGVTVLPFDLDIAPSANKVGTKDLPDLSERTMQQYNISPAYKLEQRTANQHHSYRPDSVSPDEQIRELEGQIQELQRESRESPLYQDKVVVALRQGIMEFRAENQATDHQAYGGRFNHKIITDANQIPAEAITASLQAR